jgi:Tfp pilus assembly protein PilF
MVYCDNGSEFSCQAMDLWTYQNGVRITFSRPGKPADNAFVESFYGTFRAECMSTHCYTTLTETRRIAETWYREYSDRVSVSPKSNKRMSRLRMKIGPLPTALWAAGLIFFSCVALAGQRAEVQHAGPDAGDIHYQKGLAAFGKHDWPTAIRQLRWTLEYMPKSPKVHNSLGLAYLKDGKADLAVIEFRRAVALAPDFAEAYYNMAQALDRRGDQDGATQFYQWAINSQLPKAETHDARGFLLARRGDLAGAESEFEAALRDEPSLSSAHSHLGITFWRQQEYAEAVAELKKAIALDPSNAEAHYYEGLASRHLNQDAGSPPKLRRR